MNVVYASDDNFAEILGVSMLSLFENNKDVDEITVFILDDSIKEVNRNRLKEVAQSYNRKIVFLPLNELKAKLSKMNQKRGSISTFSRLFLSELVPHDCDRLLYLDADTIVRRNLSELYNTDFEGNIVCGVMDCISKQHRARIGLRENSVYINAGVMLIDFKAWLERHIEQEIEKVIAKFRGSVPYADQGIVNLALKNSLKCVHPRFNCMSIFTAFSFNDLLEYRQPSACASSVEIESAKMDPSIVHFVTLFCLSRPWIEKSDGPFFDEWRMYKQKSPWKDEPERVGKSRKIPQKLGMWLYNVAPKSVGLTILGFLHARIKPIFNI